MKRIVLLAPLFLAACGTAIAPRGTTHVTLDGSICGQPFRAKVADGKERTVFVARAKCADGSYVVIRSGDSKAFEGQANADQVNIQALNLLDKVLEKVVPVAP